MIRKNLFLKAALFESLLGDRLRVAFPEGKVVHDKRLACRCLQRNETQIDLILATAKAVYVIEAKNWSRSIAGTYDDLMWRGVGNKVQGMNVYSPVMQNLLHIRLLKATALRLGRKFPPVFNIVCVPDSCEIKSPCKEIIHESELVQYVKKIEEKITTKYDLAETLFVIGKGK